MDLKQLEAYINVVELHSFSKAADVANISQPSISAYINALEQEFGIQLIYRSPKEIALTEAGKLFYHQAKKLIIQKEKLLSLMNQFKGGVAGVLNIAASSVPSQYILPKVIARFAHIYPNIRFNINQLSSSDVVNAVTANNFEIGFTGAKIDNTRCEYIHVIADQLAIIAPNSSDYATMTTPLEDQDLYRLPFIQREKGSGTSISYKAALENIGIRWTNLHTIASFSDTQSIINAVSAGLGVAIVSDLAVADALKNGYVIRLFTKIPLASRKIYMVYKKNQERSPMANLFKAFILEQE